jgi:antitoxin (DNA-binding transcriptional repressor) of toxin-antitoxin stability system
METVTIQEAQAMLPELIHRLAPGEDVVIIENDQPVARLLSAPRQPATKPRRLGMMKGTVVDMDPDFDSPLDDFKEYME